MNFSAAIRHTGSVSIVDLSGQLTSFASGVLRQTIGDLMTQGNKQIVLNVGNLLYLDSSGVGALVNCYMSDQAGRRNESGGSDAEGGRSFEDHAALSNFSGISKRRRSSPEFSGREETVCRRGVARSSQSKSENHTNTPKGLRSKDFAFLLLKFSYGKNRL